MASEVTVANRALTHLGIGDLITSLDDDDVRAQRLKEVFADTRDYVLIEHSWNCATVRKQLAASVLTPVDTYGFAHPLPNDFLDMVEMTNLDKDYRIESGMILYRSTPIIIRYIWQNTNPASWPAYLRELVSIQLAYLTCKPLNGSDALKVELGKLYQTELSKAKGKDSVADGRPPDQPDELVRVRY